MDIHLDILANTFNGLAPHAHKPPVVRRTRTLNIAPSVIGAGVTGRSTQVEVRAGVHAQDKERGREGVDGGRGWSRKLEVHRVIVLLITVRFRMEQSSNSPAEFPENKLALGSWWPGHSVLRRHCTA